MSDTKHMGLGVALNMLGGNRETVEALTAAAGRRIERIDLVEETWLVMGFADGSVLSLRDDGQSCCEYRYMRTDDDLAQFVGADFLGAEVRDGPSIADEYGETHEIQFLVVSTSKGAVTMASHNEHNGYYGGFWIVARFNEAP